MIEIKKYFKELKDKTIDAATAKTLMEEILKINTEKAISFEEISLICPKYKITDPEILWIGWQMLINEHKDGKPFISFQDTTFGATKPLVFQKEIFENGKSVLYVGLHFSGWV